MPGKFKLPLIVALSCLSFLGVSFSSYLVTRNILKSKNQPLISPLAAEESSQEIAEATPSAELSDPFHLLLLGLDRHSREQRDFRTDTIMVVSILKEAKKVILTSIPRDLWLDGQKINAYYANDGFDKFKERIAEVTGLQPSHYVTVDFDAAVWAVDQLDGVETEIERSFTDYNYPPDRSGAPHPPSFQTGIQILNGEEALQYCRSRKGTAGEGSDFRRMRRQQNLLKSMPQAFEESNLVKLGVEALYNLLTGHLETNLGVGETASLLWLFKDWREFEIEQIVLDTENFLYHPPMAAYGGAYVLRPNGESFEAIHKFVTAKLTKVAVGGQ